MPNPTNTESVQFAEIGLDRPAPFDFVQAFQIEDADTNLHATVCFANEDYTKPLSVHITDRHYGTSVSIPFDLFERFVAGVQKASDQ
jgi:hypothetical protein